MIVVITGRIATGKTTVASYLNKFGANLIDADKLGHELLKRNDIKKKVIKLLGKDIIKGKSLDRKKIASKVFENRKVLLQYNNIIHISLIKKIKEKVKKRKINVVDAALFYELELDKIADKVIVVKSRNVFKKDFLKRQKFIKKIKKYDFVVNNSKDKKHLRKQAREIWKKLNSQR